MEREPERDVPEIETEQEELFTRLKPENDIEERLVRQIVLCSTKLEYIEALLARAGEQLRKVMAHARDESPL